MEKAIKALKLATTYAEDGAPADALRHVLIAADCLYKEVCARYFGTKEGL